MVKNLILLFLALRAADILNLAGGLWLVPKYVAPEDLGAVLPLTTLATVISIPLFALAMTALRESSRLRAEGLDAQLRSFVRGIFAAVGIVTIVSLIVAAALLPRSLERYHLSDSLSGFLAVAAAFLGCVAPVYLDQLQAAKRFGIVSLIEVSAAALRLGTMAILMPIRALAGFYAGGVVRTLTQILGPLIALRDEGITARSGDRSPSCDSADNRGCGIPSAPYWTRDHLRRLAKTFLLLLPYLALPMIVSFTENDLIRTRLSSADSAGYYMATRISDLMNTFSYPLMFVMFPYVTDHATQGKSHTKLTLSCCGLLIGIAVFAIIFTDLIGAEKIISLLPNGENFTAYATHLGFLILFMAFGAVQTIITNAEAAAGRFSFLWWLVPLNITYITLLPRLMKEPTLKSLVAVFMLFALLRAVGAWIQIRFVSSDSCRSAREDTLRISDAPDRSGSVRN